jgi:hypothetical protein
MRVLVGYGSSLAWLSALRAAASVAESARRHFALCPGRFAPVAPEHQRGRSTGEDHHGRRLRYGWRWYHAACDDRVDLRDAVVERSIF